MSSVASILLAWYDRHRRDLPWRAPPGVTPDPYRVWLSEIMLQQTTVATVGPYFRAFLERWLDVQALAAASLDDVLHAWQGLGYYARARNMHACARAVATAHGGRFPSTEAGLAELPGIGPYTAAAIAAIAFGAKATVVDGNVERVVARLFALETPLPDAKPEIRRLTATLVPEMRAGDFAQGLMDLGATICVPANPKCILCPLTADCRARAAGIAAELPRRKPKKARPLRHGIAFWLTREDGAVLLRRRAPNGLLGGMIEVPSTEWREGGCTLSEASKLAPATARWKLLPGLVEHGFTHFQIEFQVATARIAGAGPDGIWCAPDQLHTQALPTLMKKICRHALDGGQ